MKRLISQEKNIKNTAQEYDRIFLDRKGKGVDWFDLKRWHTLVSKFYGGKLIDLGCLDSLVPFLAKEKIPSAEIYGIDCASMAICEMGKAYPEITFEVGDIYKTRFDSEYFDYAVAGEVIEHLERPEDFIRETFRILAPGGTFALSTPLQESEAGEIDHERHLWSFSKKDILDLLTPYGIVKTHILGSDYFPKYKYHFPVIVAFCKKS